MSPEANEAIVRRYWEAWNTGDVSILDEVISADYVFTDTAGRVLHGSETPKRSMVRWYRGFPNTHFTVDELFTTGDRVTVRWTGRATHQGEIDIIQQMPAPAGQAVTWFGVDIYRIAQGKIVEMWRVWDRLGLLQQLGVAL